LYTRTSTPNQYSSQTSPQKSHPHVHPPTHSIFYDSYTRAHPHTFLHNETHKSQFNELLCVLCVASFIIFFLHCLLIMLFLSSSAADFNVTRHVLLLEFLSLFCFYSMDLTLFLFECTFFSWLLIVVGWLMLRFGCQVLFWIN